MEKIKKRLGCIPDREDKRDFQFRKPLLTFLGPRRIDWSPYFTKVKDQGNEGTCVGFATTAAREFWYIKKSFTDLTKRKIFQKHFGFVIDLSERFVYEEAKKRDFWAGEDYEGTSIRAAMKTLRALGVCREEFWPYTPRRKGRPGRNYLVDAKSYIISKYWRVNFNVSSLKCALRNGPIVIGINVPGSLFVVGSSGIVKESEEASFGGHAMVLVGYDDSRKMFKVRNSWGQNWGDNGYCYFSYKYLPKLLFSAWQFV